MIFPGRDTLLNTNERSEWMKLNAMANSASTQLKNKNGNKTPGINTGFLHSIISYCCGLKITVINNKKLITERTSAIFEYFMIVDMDTEYATKNDMIYNLLQSIDIRQKNRFIFGDK